MESPGNEPSKTEHGERGCNMAAVRLAECIRIRQHPTTRFAEQAPRLIGVGRQIQKPAGTRAQPVSMTR